MNKVWDEQIEEYDCSLCKHDGTKDGHCDECNDYGTLFDEKIDEDKSDNISVSFLLNHGFHIIHKSNLLSKRIHALIYLEYDRNDDFVTLVRKEEIVKHNIDSVKITIPKKIETQQDLLDLLKVMGDNSEDKDKENNTFIPSVHTDNDGFTTVTLTAKNKNSKIKQRDDDYLEINLGS